MLRGLIQEVPLLISSLIVHAGRHHGETEIVSRTIEGPGRGRLPGASIATPIATRISARASSPRRCRLGVNAATASAPWPGTAIAMSSLSTPSPAWARSATPSTRACFPSRSSTSSTMPRTAIFFFDINLCAAGREASRRNAKGVKAWMAMTDRAHMPGATPEPALLRGADRGRERRLRLAAIRRGHGLVAVLHLGHHRQSQGRALFAPLDRAALLCRGARPTRSACPRATWCCRWCRCSTPMPGACPISAPMVGAQAGVSRRGARRQERVRAVRGGEGDLRAGVPTVWLGAADYLGAEQAPLPHLEAHGDRRLGLSAGDDQDASRRSTASRCCMPGA